MNIHNLFNFITIFMHLLSCTTANYYSRPVVGTISAAPTVTCEGEEEEELQPEESSSMAATKMLTR